MADNTGKDTTQAYQLTFSGLSIKMCEDPGKEIAPLILDAGMSNPSGGISHSKINTRLGINPV